MKGKLISKLLENRKLVRTGCGLMAAVVLLSGGLYVYDAQNTYMPELTIVVDDDEEVIFDEDVPLASAPKVTTKTTTKKSTKAVKIAQKSTKTYTKKLPTKTTTKTTTKTSATQTVKTVVKTQTAQSEVYVKNLAKKYVVTTVKTTTTTTTTLKEVAPKATTTKAVATTTNATSTAVVKKSLDPNTVLVKADAKLVSAFTQMGFTIHVDSTVSYSGKFDARTRTITMRKENDDAIYHELGHFLAFIGGINTTSATGDGTTVYQAEKSKYTGVNQAYVNQNADEYFAESYRDYCTNRDVLQQTRPQTYDLVVKALNNVTSAQIAKYQRVYASVWQ